MDQHNLSSGRIDHAVTAGTFSLDGETFDVDNNVWVVGDDAECVIIDAPHNVEDILRLVGPRRVAAILCTHAHDDHVRLAPRLAELTGAPIHLHPADAPVWALAHPGLRWDMDIIDGDMIEAGGSALRVIHTPGHSPGSVCFHAVELDRIFTGDTLFSGGPGATGRSFSSHDTILSSIRERLCTLPDQTVVHTGHGPDTTIGAERLNLARNLLA
jgi:glyoxylase-like metal-dependent hydrolase (beta-lactamase superfamily II)